MHPSIPAVVIPAYNESATLRDIVQRALQFCPKVIVVDDGSTDATAQSVRDLPIELLGNPGNEGKAASLWRGIRHAIASGADRIITLDADGQHMPEHIPSLIEAARTHPQDIVIGARRGDRSVAPALRYYANRFADFWISWACGQRLRDSQSGFRLYPAALFDRLHTQHDRAHGFVFESEILIEAARLGYHVTAVPIPAIYHIQARPSYYRTSDSLRITRMVAWKLLSRGMFLRGLYPAFFKPA